MPEPIASWLVRNKFGERIGRRSIYLAGEQPEGIAGEPSDDGRHVLVIEEPPLPPLPEPRLDLAAADLARQVDSPEANLYRAIDAYRTHGDAALPVFWAELDRGQRIRLGRFSNDLMGFGCTLPDSPPPIVRFVRLVVACADGMPLPPPKRYRRKPAKPPTMVPDFAGWDAKRIIRTMLELRRVCVAFDAAEIYRGLTRAYRTACTQKVNAVMGHRWEDKVYDDSRRFELFIEACFVGKLTLPQQGRFVRWL